MNRTTTVDRMLGPATVLGREGDDLRLQTPAGERRARLALAYPYDPEPGDVVLIIGEEEAYVIGVLRGRGVSTVSVPGDLRVEAGGTVRIQGGRGVEVDGPRVAVRGETLSLEAKRLFTRAGRAYQWVREALSTVAGRVRLVSRGAVSVRGKRIVEFAEKDVKIDGKQVHLG